MQTTAVSRVDGKIRHSSVCFCHCKELPPAENSRRSPHGGVVSYLGDLLYVSQKDLLIAGDRGRAVVIHQLVEGVELHYPEEILSSSVTEDLEMLHIISKPGKREKLDEHRSLETFKLLRNGPPTAVFRVDRCTAGGAGRSQRPTECCLV